VRCGDKGVLKGTHTTPDFSDVDRDGQEDARVVLAGDWSTWGDDGRQPLVARWEAIGQGYQASLSGTVTGVGAGPLSFRAGISPNPTHGRAVIRFTLPAAGRVKLSVFDVAGHRVAQLVDRWLAAGEYNEVFKKAQSHSAQVYWYRLEWEDKKATGKFTLLP
jgi:hypothetical protein